LGSDWVVDAAAGQYTGRWFDEKFVKPEKDGDEQLKPERLWRRTRLRRSRQMPGKQGIVTQESKPTTSMSPTALRFDEFTADANSRFGFSAKNTLDLAQALYERHKVPDLSRTDSRALPEDYMGRWKMCWGCWVARATARFADTI